MFSAGTGSERPIPRLSKTISRENDASAQELRDGRLLPVQVEVRDPAGHVHELGRPSPITWYAMWYSPLRAYFVASGRPSVGDRSG